MRERDIQTDRDRQTARQTETETDRQLDRQTETEREGGRELELENFNTQG